MQPYFIILNIFFKRNNDELNLASQMLKFWVNNPKTSHISRYNNIKRMYVHKTLCSYFSSQSIFKYRNNFDVMKNANFLIFFQTLNVFLSFNLIIHNFY